MGDWLEVNGEAIYGTRPWAVHGEGPNLLDEGRGFGGEQVDFTGEDIRYTCKGDVLYAIALGWPEKQVTTIKSMARLEKTEIKSVTMLGNDGALEWSLDEKGMTIKTPKKKPCDYAYVFKISL